jgi:hypothetical protein
LNEDLNVQKLKENSLNYFGLKAEIFQKTDLNLWSQNPISNNQLLREINFEII